MKRFAYFTIILAILLGTVTGLAFGQSGTPPSRPGDQPSIYLPVFFGKPQFFTVSGQVTDTQNHPLAGVTVTDNSGRTTISDSNGNYNLSGLPPGGYALAASHSRYVFSPAMLSGNLPGPTTHIDFHALAACSDVVVNGGFETTTGWDFPVTPFQAGYSTANFHSGTSSARTGILNAAENVYSYSSARSFSISIPVTATSVTLNLWLYPLSSEAANAPVAQEPSALDFGYASMANDAQYVGVVQPGANLASDNWLQTLMWARSNNQAWTLHTFDLTKYAGRNIKIQAGSYNDGFGGVTGLYVDDIALQVCSGGGAPPPPPPPPPPGGCGDIVVNPGFEASDGWAIPITAFTAGYSTAQAHAGTRSMRTGITAANQNKYSYSDAYQLFDIPSDATSADFSMWVFTSSTAAALSQPDTVQLPEIGQMWGEAPLANDLQYVLVLDPNGFILQWLWRGQPSNTNAWTQLSFNLHKYKGQTIRVQFGTFNNGSDGITSMFVDDAAFNICRGTPPPPTPTPVPTPTPPPGTCRERIGNNSFEANSDWYIPATHFTAGYSTDLAHTGTRSMRTGITAASFNRFSYSDAGQQVLIPSNSTSATLSLWVYPKTTEATGLALPEPLPGTQFGAVALSKDVQYVLVLDAYGNWIDTLLWQRNNTAAWTNHTFNLSRYIGMTIRIQFGTYNDGLNGITSMYVDDVTLQACP